MNTWLDRGRRWLHAVAATACLATAPAVKAAEPELQLITRQELHALGIGIWTDAVPADELIKVPPKVAEPFENACFGTITVSNELLARMQKQGFTLTTLCIGLVSSHLAFHPETGARLTRVRVPTLKSDLDQYPIGAVDLLIDIPRCFARGTPYLDCKMRHEWDLGQRLSAEETQEWAAKGAAIDAAMKRLIAAKAFARPCTCNDFQADELPAGAMSHFGDVRLRERALCRSDFLPACPKLRSTFTTEGSMTPGIDGGASGPIHALLQRTQPKLLEGWGVLNENFHVSDDLPNGYAYNPRTPEGDKTGKVKRAKPESKLSVGSR